MKPIRLFLISFLLPFIPETRGFALKRQLFGFAGIELGPNVKICSSVKIRGNGKLEIGENSWVGHNVQIVTTSHIKVGANVDIAPNVYIGTGTHKIDSTSARIAGEGVSKNVTIGNGSWLCVGAIILPGTVLEQMCVVSAGSVVSGQFESFSMLGGMPAKIIKSLKPE